MTSVYSRKVKMEKQFQKEFLRIERMIAVIRRFLVSYVIYIGKM